MRRPAYRPFSPGTASRAARATLAPPPWSSR